MVRFRKNKLKSTPDRRVGSDLPKTENRAAYRISRTLSSFRPANLSANYVDSERAKSHALASHRRKTGLIFILLLSGILLIGSLIYSLTAVVKISFTDTRVRQSVEASYYENALTDYMDSNLVARLRFLLNPERAQKSLASKYPEIKEISDVGKVNLFETNYSISFRRPVAGWKINDKQYYVDSDGISFDKNYFEAPTVQIVDDSGIKVEQGSLVASNRFLNFVGKIVSGANSKGYEVVEAKLPVDTTRQLDIKLKGVKPYIKLSIDRGVGVQIEDMDNALKFLFSHNLSPEYVDIRASGKAFYR